MNHFDGLNILQLIRGKRVACPAFAASLFLLVIACSAALGQVAESGDLGRARISVGTTASYYYLQYGGVKNLGLTAYLDADSPTRLGFEGEGRWLQFHETNDILARTYLAGPRYHFTVGRFQPYLKGLSGLGLFNFTYNYAHGSYYVIAGGGGLDYRLSPRWSARVDGEYQYWPQFTFGSMSSGGISIGVRCHILK